MGLVRYVFSLPEVKENQLALLSQHICQDPLENFFGCQRQRGGTSDNPSAQEYYRNAQALRVVNSFCRAPVRGNCRGGGAKMTIETMTAHLYQSDMQTGKNLHTTHIIHFVMHSCSSCKTLIL